jgi:hypothetical protein
MRIIEQRQPARKPEFSRIQRPHTFARWQPYYAEHGIATFPLRMTEEGQTRTPAIKHYGRIGLKQSARFALDPKFARARGFGFVCGPRSKITVGDMDTTDENLVADLLDRHGNSPLIARTASGRFHAYYKHNGEPRKIRLYGDSIPFDLLGGGMAVAPPSQLAKGGYRFIQGKLDDLDRLPTIKGIEVVINAPDFTPDGVYNNANDNAEVYDQGSPAWVSEGQRNNESFRHCMRRAHYLDSLQALIVEADDFYRNHCERQPVIEAKELLKIAKSAWNYTEAGLNRFGQHGFWAPKDDYADMVLKDTDAFALLAYLKMMNHSHGSFMIANGLAKSFHWAPQRLAAARQRLLELNHIELSRPATRHYGAALYRWSR